MRYWSGDVVAPGGDARWTGDVASRAAVLARRAATGAARHVAHTAKVLWHPAHVHWPHPHVPHWYVPRGHRSLPAHRHLRLLGAGVLGTLLAATAAAAHLGGPGAGPAGARLAASAGWDHLTVRGTERPPTDRAPEPAPGPVPPSAPAAGPASTVLAASEVAPGPAPGAAPAPTVLPTGKGMWFNRLEYSADGRDPGVLVKKARAAGLTHLYLRLGSSKDGFYARGDLDRVLAAAHAGGLKIVGWDFPYLDDPAADADRAAAEIAYTTPTGDRIDAFAADIETQGEGVKLSAANVEAYGARLRERAGPGYPLIGTVPNPGFAKLVYPFDVVAKYFDAFAPMVYWINRDPASDLVRAMDRLAPLGRPVLPIGQAYDPALDDPALVGLVPTREQIQAFLATAAAKGAAGVSFWAWHTATPEQWAAIAAWPDFDLVPLAPGAPDGVHVRALQRVLGTYGLRVQVDGLYGPSTVDALARLQRSLGLPPTGALDDATVRVLAGHR